MQELTMKEVEQVEGGIVFLAPIIAGMGGGSSLAMAGAAAVHIGGRLAAAYGMYTFYSRK